MSVARSRSTVQVNIDSESEEDSASMFEQTEKRCFATPEGPPPSKAATKSVSTMQQAYVSEATETEPAKATHAAKASDLDEALLNQEPPAAPMKKRPTEKGQSSKAVHNNDEMDALADILLTPVNEKIAATDLEKLRMKMVKQVAQLEQKHAEVLSLIQEAKVENDKVSAKKNLFTTTPLAAKPPRKSTLQDVDHKKYKSPAQRLGFDWASTLQRTDRHGDLVLCTPMFKHGDNTGHSQ